MTTRSRVFSLRLPHVVHPARLVRLTGRGSQDRGEARDRLEHPRWHHPERGMTARLRRLRIGRPGVFWPAPFQPWQLSGSEIMGPLKAHRTDGDVCPCCGGAGVPILFGLPAPEASPGRPGRQLVLAGSPTGRA
jgi:hypothetical protein